MTSLALTNIETLVTNSADSGDNQLGLRSGATVVIDGSTVVSITDRTPDGVDSVIDCSGKTVLPGFVDSHSHLIFAGDRSAEFAARARGQKYSAGGIMTTVAATRAAATEDLQANAQRLLNEALAHGTTTVEIKTGYGLTVAQELRSLDIAEAFTEETTLLAAHVIPEEYSHDPDGYVDLIISSVIPVARAKWIDVFCDKGAFSEEQTEKILTAGIAAGMTPRIHANQITRTNSVALAIKLGAASADHLSQSSTSDIEALAASSTVATLLPGAEFSTGGDKQVGRKFLDAGAQVAIASDCNPGSSYTTSMPFCIAAAVSTLGFTVEEAVYAATAGGAAALRRKDIGYLAPGATADLVVLDTPSYIHLAYRPGVNVVKHTIKSGRVTTTWTK